MTIRWRNWFAIVLLLSGPASLSAQDATSAQPPEPAPALTQTVATQTEPAGWELVASRAERITETGDASRFALRQIRSELVDWRSAHRADLSVNAGRLATIAQQLDALGPPPEDGDSDPQIAARRELLIEDQTRLMRPRTLAAEAYARADGLIAEVDRLSRRRDTAALGRRVATPLIPNNWVEALAPLGAGAASMIGETRASLGVLLSDGRLWGRIAMLAVASAIVYAVIGPIRTWLAHGAQAPVNGGSVLRRLWQLLLSLSTIIVPVVGLTIASIALILSGLFGVTGEHLVSNIPVAGAVVWVAIWLADGFFPPATNNHGILGYDLRTRLTGRKLTLGLGWVLSVWTLVSVLIDGASGSAYVMLRFPFVVVAGVLLWHLGRQLAAPAQPDSTTRFTQGYLRRVLGKLTQSVAVLGPVAALIGYGAAAWAVIEPAIMSLAVLGGVVAVQNVIYAGDVAPQDSSDDGPDPKRTLFPVLASFSIVLASVPVLALIWGVRFSELSELWTSFITGFAVGETRISPASFATFLMVFLIGYAITRFVKGSLKNTVMPRTKLDLGGQNAVVAGFGYVGILLSALVAFSVAGIDLSSLAIVAGALSVGIGFGLQTIVSNFVSGIILLIERPIGEGDMIEVNGQMGFVRDISVRSTRIETFDRTDVIVPNADLVSGQVINWTRGNLVGRAIVNVGVAYGTDTKKVQDILQEVANAHPMVLLNPAPSVLLTGLGADSIDFEVRAILRDVNFVLSVKSDLLHEVIRRFGDEGIEIPFAQRDIWLRNPQVLQTTEAT